MPRASDDDLALLRETVAASMDDPNLVAIGEIGLDYFLPNLCTPEMRARQEHFFQAQLKIARDFGLPVLLHVRRSQDISPEASAPRRPAGRHRPCVQRQFPAGRDLHRSGLQLGFGGAMTFPRALQIRRLAATVPESALVLETDAPDISPVWLHPARNTPEQLPRIGAALAELRCMPVEEIARLTTANAQHALPRLQLPS